MVFMSALAKTLCISVFRSNSKIKLEVQLENLTRNPNAVKARGNHRANASNTFSESAFEETLTNCYIQNI